MGINVWLLVCVALLPSLVVADVTEQVDVEQCALALHRSGGVGRDWVSCRRLLKSGDTAAISRACKTADGVGINNPAAVNALCSALAAEGDLYAQQAMGVRAALLYDSNDAIRWLEKSARQGGVRAQYLLGALLFGSRHDAESARLWLARAAQAGSQDATSLLVRINSPEELAKQRQARDEARRADEQEKQRDIDFSDIQTGLDRFGEFLSRCSASDIADLLVRCPPDQQTTDALGRKLVYRDYWDDPGVVRKLLAEYWLIVREGRDDGAAIRQMGFRIEFSPATVENALENYDKASGNFRPTKGGYALKSGPIFKTIDELRNYVASHGKLKSPANILVIDEVGTADVDGKSAKVSKRLDGSFVIGRFDF